MSESCGCQSGPLQGGAAMALLKALGKQGNSESPNSFSLSLGSPGTTSFPSIHLGETQSHFSLVKGKSLVHSLAIM